MTDNSPIPALYLVPQWLLAEPVVQKIDANKVYSLAAALFPLGRIKNAGPGEPGMSKQDVHFCVFTAHHVLEAFLKENPLSLRKSVIKDGRELLAAIVDLEPDVSEVSKWNEKFGSLKFPVILAKLAAFQSVLRSEFGDLPLYLVSQKGGFETEILLDAGETLFPAELKTKVPDAIPDIQNGARCIAFELATAAAYHLHRANEAVMRAYYDVVTNKAPRPDNRSMGNYLGEMDKRSAGDKEIKDSLRNLAKNHRNPLIHPEHSLSNVNEAIQLLNAIHAVVVPMLKVIP